MGRYGRYPATPGRNYLSRRNDMAATYSNKPRLCPGCNRRVPTCHDSKLCLGCRTRFGLPDNPSPVERFDPMYREPGRKDYAKPVHNVARLRGKPLPV